MASLSKYDVDLSHYEKVCSVFVLFFVFLGMWWFHLKINVVSRCGQTDGLQSLLEAGGVDVAKEPESNRSRSGGGGAIAATLSVEQEPNGAALAEPDEFEENYLELRKWVDVGSLKFILLSVKREMRAGRIGSAIKVISVPIRRSR